MSFSRRGESLSKRLKILHHHYSSEENIWDIGCDHGLLGMSFEDNPQVKKIHFVDPSAPVIDVLKQTLKDSYITKAEIFQNEGQELTIKSPSNCIFIAGMGGKEIGEIMTALLPQLKSDSKFVISPHRKILELRSQLVRSPLTLLSEEVIEEDGQFYQVLVLRVGQEGRKVSLFGEDIWEGETGEKYLEHQLKYFSVHRDEASSAYVEYLKVRKSLKNRDNTYK